MSFFSPAFVGLHVALLAIVGACLGSFFNVCIYRIPLGVPLSFPGSHCYRCGQPVRWHDNLPLLSYWILRGRCRDCDAPFSMRYFLVELLTMLVLMGAALRVGYSLTLVPAWIFTSLLIVAAFTDIDHWIIPDRVSLGGLVAGLALAAIPAVASARLNPLTPSNPDSLVLLFMETCLRWLPRAFWPLANSVIGAAAGGLGLWSVGVVGSLVFRKEAMGMGDVKLFAMFGAFCGLGGLLPILMIASVIGMGVGLWGFVASKRAASRPGVSPDPAIAPACLGAEAQAVLLASHGLDGEERAVVAEALAHPGPFGGARHHLPFGPSLAIAAYVVYLWGGDLTRLVFYWLDPARGVGW